MLQYGSDSGYQGVVKVGAGLFGRSVGGEGLVELTHPYDRILL